MIPAFSTLGIGSCVALLYHGITGQQKRKPAWQNSSRPLLIAHCCYKVQECDATEARPGNKSLANIWLPYCGLFVLFPNPVKHLLCTLFVVEMKFKYTFSRFDFVVGDFLMKHLRNNITERFGSFGYNTKFFEARSGYHVFIYKAMTAIEQCIQQFDLYTGIVE